MYTYVSCLSRTNAVRPQYVKVDISGLQCNAIMHDYIDNWVILSSPFLSANVSLRLQDNYFSEISNFNGTFNQWLASLGNRALTTTTKLPNMKEHSAKFVNLNQYWFKQTPTNINYSAKKQFSYEDATDLLITKDNTDYQYLFDRSLYTVNGYIHRSSLSVDGIYLLDAIKSAKVPNDTHTGVLTFNNVTTLSCHQITPDQLRSATPGSSYNEQIIMQLPFDATGKQVAIVIGGILYWQDNALNVIGPKLASINTMHINWVDRYFYDRDWINLTSIPTGIDPEEPNVIYNSVVRSEEFYKAWLSLTQSFWVVFDNPNVEIETIPLTSYRWPGQYGHVNDDPIPVQLTNGVIAESLVQPGDEQAQLYVRHYTRRNALNTTVQYKGEPMVTDYSLMSSPWKIPNASWLKISAY